jgi:hypothetical protein
LEYKKSEKVYILNSKQQKKIDQVTRFHRKSIPLGLRTAENGRMQKDATNDIYNNTRKGPEDITEVLTVHREPWVVQGY